jgi:hypothetical protein
MNQPLTIAEGSFVILEKRVREAGHPGLSLWSSNGRAALKDHRAVLGAAAAELEIAHTDLLVDAKATKAELFAAIERANARLAGALERLTLCTVLICILGASTFGDDDDLVRRGPRQARRRRDGQVQLLDAETGD